MSDIKVVCKNDRGESILFTWTDFTPFHLVEIEGIYGIESNVVTSENTTIDGSTYQGATAKERHIDITVEMDGDYSENRAMLYRCFPIKRTGTMEYMENGKSRVIEYEVEGIVPGETKGVVRDYTISLKCTDPYFKDPMDTEVVMASWDGCLFFPAYFPEGGREFGRRKAELVKSVENASGANNIGVTVIFGADGDVTNPAIYHAESGLFTRVGYEGNDFVMRSGQYVVISTHTRKKDIFLVESATQDEIWEIRNRYGMVDWERVVEKYGRSINEYQDEEGDYIQLLNGANNLTYSADVGIEHLLVSIFYRINYMGV